LNWFGDNQVPWGHVYQQLLAQGGFGDESDVMDDIRTVEGEAALAAVDEAICAELSEIASKDPSYGRKWLSEKQAIQQQIASREGARFALLHMPDRLFAKAVEGAQSALAWIYQEHGQPEPRIGEMYLNRLLEEQGVPYRFDDDQNRWRWIGDRAVHDEVVGPALTALDDPRLSTPASDFERALAGRNGATVASRKTAVNEAAKALEGVMAAILESHGRPVPDKLQVAVLFDPLVGEALATRDMQDVIVGGAKVSNKRGRHTNQEDITPDETEAVVMAVAVSINYLATRLAPAT
jgi:hypothetical protein